MFLVSASHPHFLESSRSDGEGESLSSPFTVEGVENSPEFSLLMGDEIASVAADEMDIMSFKARVVSTFADGAGFDGQPRAALQPLDQEAMATATPVLSRSDPSKAEIEVAGAKPNGDVPMPSRQSGTLWPARAAVVSRLEQSIVPERKLLTKDLSVAMTKVSNGASRPDGTSGNPALVSEDGKTVPQPATPEMKQGVKASVFGREGSDTPKIGRHPEALVIDAAKSEKVRDTGAGKGSSADIPVTVICESEHGIGKVVFRRGKGVEDGKVSASVRKDGSAGDTVQAFRRAEVSDTHSSPAGQSAHDKSAPLDRTIATGKQVLLEPADPVNRNNGGRGLERPVAVQRGNLSDLQGPKAFGSKTVIVSHGGAPIALAGESAVEPGKVPARNGPLPSAILPRTSSDITSGSPAQDRTALSAGGAEGREKLDSQTSPTVTESLPLKQGLTVEGGVGQRPKVKLWVEQAFAAGPEFSVREDSGHSLTPVAPGEIGSPRASAAGMTSTVLSPRFVMGLASEIASNAPGEIEVTLTPKELGTLRFRVSVHDATLMVHISADRPDTTDLVRRHLSLLQDALREQGFADVDFRFSQERGEPGENPVVFAQVTTDFAEDAGSHSQTVAQSARALDLRI